MLEETSLRASHLAACHPLHGRGPGGRLLAAAWGPDNRPRARNRAFLALSVGLYRLLAGAAAALTLLTLARRIWAFGRSMARLPSWAGRIALAGPVGTMAVFKLLDTVPPLPFGWLPAPVGLLAPVGLFFGSITQTKGTMA